MAITIGIDEAVKDMILDALAGGATIDFAAEDAYVGIYQAQSASVEGTKTEIATNDSHVSYSFDSSGENPVITIQYVDDDAASFYHCRKITLAARITDSAPFVAEFAVCSDDSGGDVYEKKAGEVSVFCEKIELKNLPAEKFHCSPRGKTIKDEAGSSSTGIFKLGVFSVGENNAAIKSSDVSSRFADLGITGGAGVTSLGKKSSFVENTNIQGNVFVGGDIFSRGCTIGRCIWTNFALNYYGTFNDTGEGIYWFKSNDDSEIMTDTMFSFLSKYLVIRNRELDSLMSLSFDRETSGAYTACSKSVGTATFSLGDSGFINESGFSVSYGGHSFSGGFYRVPVYLFRMAATTYRVGFIYPNDTSSSWARSGMLGGKICDVRMFVEE